jgi:glucose/mannose-6-phosphate isomerase
MAKSEIDKENLYSDIEKWPDQLVEGLEISKGVKADGNFQSITVSGMGGSAWPANILRIYLNDLFHSNPGANRRFGVHQNRFYNLPPEAYNNSLNIISSYSGTTEEPVASFQEVIKNDLPCVAIASGGKVLEMCEKNKIPCAVLPKGIQPRIASPYNFAVLYGILTNCGMVEDKKKDFEKYSSELSKNHDKFRVQGQEIAKVIKEKTPIVYASTKYKSLAMIWKIMFNENSKTPSFWNYFPELNHNEMIGYTNPQGKFHLLIIRDSLDHPRNLKRIEITSNLLKDYGIKNTIIDMPEGDILYRIFGTLQIGCWASYYLALEYGVDPTPVDMVEKLKALLTK